MALTNTNTMYVVFNFSLRADSTLTVELRSKRASDLSMRIQRSTSPWTLRIICLMSILLRLILQAGCVKITVQAAFPTSLLPTGVLLLVNVQSRMAASLCRVLSSCYLSWSVILWCWMFENNYIYGHSENVGFGEDLHAIFNLCFCAAMQTCLPTALEHVGEDF